MNKGKKIISTLAIASMLAGNVLPLASLAATSTADSGIYTSNGSKYVGFRRSQAQANKKLTLAEVVEKVGTVTKLNGAVVSDMTTEVITGDTVTTANETYTVVLYGDVDKSGLVDMQDALLIAKHEAGRADSQITDKALLEAANIGDHDGVVDMQDALTIAKYAALRNDTNYVIDPMPNDPEQDVPEIVSFKVTSDGTIEIKLSKPVTDSRFYLNGTLVNATPVGNKVNTYTITSSKIKLNEENTLVVTDENHTFEQTKTFIYRKLVAPDKVLVVAGAGNAINKVNSSNVNNATIQVEFTGGNRNELPVTLEVTIDDTDSKTPAITVTKELTTKSVNEEITNINLNSLKDDTLTLTAVVRDSQGNISAAITETVVKTSDVPEVKYEKVTRAANGTSATITKLKSTHNDDVMYYVVKGVNEQAPTVDEILRAHTSTTGSIAIPEKLKSSACVVYIAAQTTAGTESEEVLAIKVAKPGATQLSAETLSLRKVESTDATYSFGYTDLEKEEAEGFIGYKLVLTDASNEIIYEKEIKKGEEKKIDLFEILKKQEPTSQNANVTYKLKVSALADNENYTNSDYTDEETITISPILTNMQLTLNKTDKTITWTQTGDVANVKDYKIEIAKYDKTKTSKEYETIVASAVVPSIVNYDISKVVEENGAGTYEFKVTANAKDDILMANASSAEMNVSSYSTNNKYHQGEGIINLSAEIKDGKVLLKGTLLSATDIFDGSVTPTYTAYYKEASSKSYTSTGTTITALPDTSVAVSSLNPGTEYTFMVETTVDGNKYYSNESSIKTETSPIVATNVKYVKHDENSPVTTLANSQITYKDGILYVKNGKNAIVQYSSEVYPEVLDIISVLDQMGESDTISINGKITALALISDKTKASNYDLSKVPETATVTLTGNSSYMATVSGKVANTTVNGAGAKIDLSNLTVTGKVTVGAANEDLYVANNATLTFANKVKSVKVNDVKITDAATAQLRDTLVTSNGFRFTGSNDKLTVDASEATTNVNIEFVGTNQKGLDIISNDTNGVALLTNQQLINELVIKTGKVDVSKAVYNCLTAGTIAGANKVTLVTGKTANEDVRGKDVTKVPVMLDWLGYNIAAKENNIAKYDSDADSDILTLTFNADSTVNDFVKLSKPDGETLSSKKLDPAKMTTEDSQLGTNMGAIGTVSVDKNTNTITVNVAKKDNMSQYMSAGGNCYWYAIIIDTGIPREYLTSGTRYDITSGDEKTYSDKLGAEGKISDTEILIYLDASDPETVVSFIDSRTGDEHFYTVKVNNGPEKN